MDHMRTMVRTGYYFNALHAPFQLLDYHNSTNHFWACQAIEISGFEEERWIQNECGQCILVWELPIFLQSTLRSIECTSTKPRLTNHLTTVHRIPDGARRRELAARAREAEAVWPGVRKVSITITAAFQLRMMEKRSSFLLVLNVVVRKWSTKHYQHFDTDKDPRLLSVVKNLQSFDEGKRSQQKAWEMASDVSKFLAFACDEAKWQSLLR